MRAAVVTSEGQIQVREVENPKIGDFDVRCRMLYGTVCAGTDTHIVDRDFPDVTYPLIIGHESVGEVIELGPRVENFTIGEHVTRVSAQASTAGLALSGGGMCEYGVARDHQAMKTHGLPPSQWERYRINKVIPSGLLDDVYEPMFITWRETLSFINRLGVRPGCRILISGSGANGLSLAAMATALGAESILIGSAKRSQEGRTVASTYIDYRNSADVSHFIEQSRGTMDVLIDATGNSKALNQLLPTLANGGSIAVYGLDELHGYAIEPLQPGGSFRFYNEGYDEAEAHDQVIQLIRRKVLDPTIWIDRQHIYDWSNIGEAFISAATRTQIKPVIRLTSMSTPPGEAAPARLGAVSESPLS